MVEFELRKRHTSLHFEMTDYRNDPRLMSMKGYRTCLFVPRRVSNKKYELLILRGRLGFLHLCFWKGPCCPYLLFSVPCFVFIVLFVFVLCFLSNVSSVSGLFIIDSPSGFSKVYLHDVTGYRLLLLNNGIQIHIIQ